MLIIPAIDIKDGKCVRLKQGDFAKEVIYDDNPIEVAGKWEKQGAKLLHIVDLDGAKTGKIKHLSLIAEIIRNISIPVEVGGGIRDLETIKELFAAGVGNVILSTLAYENPSLLKKICERYRGKISLSIDAKEGFFSIKGWQETTKEKAIDFAQRMEDSGVRRFIYTDIKRDGTLSGINLEGIKKFSTSVGGEVIASGGLGKIEDVIKIKNLKLDNLTGVIIGKALYTGAINLEKVIEIANE